MKMTRVFWLILTLLFTNPVWAFQSRVVAIPSAAMHKSFDATVVLPDQYTRGKAGDRFPVVYLLHGSGGDYTDWTANSHIGKLADRYHVILVMPDGGHESWYIDSPVDPHSRYETYIGTEVVAYIDTHFRTIATRQARAITGLRMGG
ncbi:alpha/beta hydrolase-fold protein, partial [Klebsiella pneumoniae]|nr:alpha/beta hydrolase-fold protein [Klebsiella pneumoniae]